MKQFEQKLDAIMRCLAADLPEDRELARSELKSMISDSHRYAVCNSTEQIIRQILLELGMPDHLRGHAYLVYAIESVIQHPHRMYAITGILYPDIAHTFDATTSQVERSIRHAIEICWDRGDMDVMARYFGNTVSASRGKPTNGEFISRVVNLVRKQLQTAA